MAVDEKRVKALYEIGLNYNGDSFVYEDVNVHWTELTCMDDDEFYSLVDKLRPIVIKRKEKTN